MTAIDQVMAEWKDLLAQRDAKKAELDAIDRQIKDTAASWAEFARAIGAEVQTAAAPIVKEVQTVASQGATNLAEAATQPLRRVREDLPKWPERTVEEVRGEYEKVKKGFTWHAFFHKPSAPP